MLANVLAAGIAALAALVVFLMRRKFTCGRWFLLFAVGFAILAYELLTVGRVWPISAGIISISVAMIAVLMDVLSRSDQS